MIGDATSVEGLQGRATGRLSARLRGTAKIARAIPNGERHLILAYRPGWQAPADLRAIARATQAIKTDLGRLFVFDPDILALARAAHAAIPEIPLKGCDILREAATGKLYVLELNCGGNTWHFSSRQQAADRVVNGPQFERDRRLQFDAFRTAARVLAARTNAEAE